MGRRITVGSPGLTVPYGTSAQRPADAGAGSIRFNTDLNILELYNGTAWLPVGEFQSVFIDSSDSPYQSSSGQQLFVDSSVGVVTVNLPADPQVGDRIRFFDLTKSFDSFSLTVGRNTKRIQGDTADMTVDTEGAAFDMIYSGSANGWRLLTV